MCAVDERRNTQQQHKAVIDRQPNKMRVENLTLRIDPHFFTVVRFVVRLNQHKKTEKKIERKNRKKIIFVFVYVLSEVEVDMTTTSVA